MSAPNHAAIENALSNRIAYHAATDADVPGRAGSPAALQAIYDGASLGFRVLVENGNRYTKTSMTLYADGGRITQEDATGSFVPTDDNLTDLGDASHRFRTLYLGTSITNDGDLAINLTGAASRTLNLTNSTPAQTASLYCDGNVRADGGGTFGTAVTPLATNTVDLGLTGNRWRSLYLGTKLDTPLIEHSGDVTVDLLGKSGAHTFSVTCSSGGAGRADLSVQGYLQTYGPEILMAATPNATIRANGINAGLRLRADGSGVLALRDPANAVTVIGVQNAFLVGTINDQTSANAGAGGDCTSTSSLGKAAIAAGASSCTVTVAGLTPGGMVTVTPIDRDLTAIELTAKCSAGMFVVTAAAAATAKMRFNFSVVLAAP